MAGTGSIDKTSMHLPTNKLHPNVRALAVALGISLKIKPDTFKPVLEFFQDPCRDSSCMSNSTIYNLTLPLLRRIAEWLTQTCEWVLASNDYSGYVQSICVSGDGTYIVSGADDYMINVWNVLTGECEQILMGHTELVKTLCFFDKERWIVSGSNDNTIKVWSIDTGECIRTLKPTIILPDSVCVSNNGLLIFRSFNRTANVWNLLTGECEWTLDRNVYKATSVCISSDGKYIVLGIIRDSNLFHCSVKVWNLELNEYTHTLYGQNSNYCITSVSISNDEQIVSISQDNVVKIWNLRNSECIKTMFIGLDNPICVSNDRNCIVSGSIVKRNNISSNSVEIFSINTGKRIGSIQVGDTIHSLCFSPNGQLVIFNDGRRIKIRYLNDALNNSI